LPLTVRRCRDKFARYILSALGLLVEKYDVKHFDDVIGLKRNGKPSAFDLLAIAYNVFEL